MWKKLSRIIAAVLFVSMIMGNIPLGEVVAAESIKNENQSSVENDVYFQNSETYDDNYQPEGNSNILQEKRYRISLLLKIAVRRFWRKKRIIQRI